MRPDEAHTHLPQTERSPWALSPCPARAASWAGPMGESGHGRKAVVASQSRR
jgi:hypothetical protein